MAKATAQQHGRNEPESGVDAIGTGLAERHGAVVKRVNEIIARVTKLPAKCRTDAHAITIGVWVKDCRGLTKELESLRVDEKEEFLRGGRAVDAWFKALGTRLDKVMEPVTASLDAFAEAKEEAARRKAAAEEERLRREADRLTRIASKKKATDEDIAAAADTAAHADIAGEQANASSADLVRTRGEGATVTVRKWWSGEVVDREKLDLSALRPFFSDDALARAVNAYVRAGNHGPLNGAKIEEKSESMVL